MVALSGDYLGGVNLEDDTAYKNLTLALEKGGEEPPGTVRGISVTPPVVRAVAA